MKLIKVLFFLIISTSFGVPAGFAQTPPPAAGASSSSSSMGNDVGFDAKGAFSKILIAGLVGGILGLSTLSFYDKPNNHLRNISIGAGAAMIGTALYMTFSLASHSGEESSLEADNLNRDLALIPLVDKDFGGLQLNASF